ncbi:cation transporter [Henriciella marina]|uniref:Cation transporter n=1 Tax=Henriciella marina TaxID=453851 RepID=A0ABT4LYY3_9PROT|nr:cation transporter [Henriciella marina]MCZ4299536.1 cation transporter [Henriciella marina]
MSDCCGQTSFDGTSKSYRRALLAVIAINAIMFIVELSAGYLARSQALKADALDFGGDAATYAISLAVIGMSASVRAKASLFKAGSLALIALFILGSTIARVFSDGSPETITMSIIGGLALAANLLSVLILLRWRDGDSNVRSVWLCSRNDAIGNVGVIAAAGTVALTGSPWPDLIVAALLAGLFLRSSWAITLQAVGELRQQKSGAACSTAKAS